MSPEMQQAMTDRLWQVDEIAAVAFEQLQQQRVCDREAAVYMLKSFGIEWPEEITDDAEEAHLIMERYYNELFGEGADDES